MPDIYTGKPGLLFSVRDRKVELSVHKLFAMLEMKYDFKLSKNNEMEETR